MNYFTNDNNLPLFEQVVTELFKENWIGYTRLNKNNLE